MFDKMVKAFKSALNDGKNGLEWNCDASELYNALWQIACAGIMTREQWDKINEIADKANGEP